MELDAINGSIQISARLADTAFDIIIEGNAYNPSIVDDLTNRIGTLMRVAFTNAKEHGYNFPLDALEDDD